MAGDATPTQDQKKNTALNKLKDDAINIIKDLTTLEVASFSGTVTFEDIKAAAADPNDITSNDIFNAILTALPTGKLVGYSKFELDGDAVNYLNNSLGEQDKYLQEGHSALVESAQKSRKDFFDFIMKVIK